MELYVLKNNSLVEISTAGSITWNSNLDQLGDSLNFEVAYNNDRFFPKLSVEAGDIVVLKNNNKEVFRGIVITPDIQENNISYSCFDFSFYLNKSKVVKQFNKISASKAIESLLSDFNIKASIVNIPTQINKIYYNKVVSDIIKDILEQARNETRVKYVFEMRGNVLHILKQDDLKINTLMQLSSNTNQFDVLETISNPRRRLSIEDMKNSIKIVTKDNKKVDVVAEVKDDNLIKKYGLLQEVQSIDKKDKAQAKNIASNLLQDLGKVFEENSIEVLGNEELRCGRILEVTEDRTGMKGQYVIKNANHTYKNGIHRTRLDLGVI